jgi:2-polyprenyl-3-methyl-5-hydroxy-6-metoxy-1,4-benzoquinol methylase
MHEIEAATAQQGVAALQVLGYPDDPRRRNGARLDVAKLVSDLAPLADGRYDTVFTHSPYGEVHHHPHHQDVSYAVHQVFDKVLSVAWNQYPTAVHNLTPAEYELKQHVMGTVYWQEYAALATTYEIAAQERFARISRDAAEIFYWGIGNFGDHHEHLGLQYDDVWGFAGSPYENERHDTIVELLAGTYPGRILEVGAAEGHLTRPLSALGAVDCVEPAPVYAANLERSGFRVVKNPRSSDYDVVVLAAVLEYMRDPDEYLRGVKAQYVLTDTHPFFPTRRIAEALGSNYRVVDRRMVPPRWEHMRHGDHVESMRIYKIGAHIVLWHRST